MFFHYYALLSVIRIIMYEIYVSMGEILDMVKSIFWYLFLHFIKVALMMWDRKFSIAYQLI